MKSIIAIFIVFISLNYSSTGQHLVKIADLNINTLELAKSIQYQMTQFIFRSKQKTSFHAAYDLMDIIKPHINNIDMNLKNNLIFIFENPDGEVVTASYSDFDNLLTSMPAVLMFDRKNMTTTDSVSLSFEDEEEIDMSALDEQLSGFSAKKRIHLQMKTIPVSEKTRMLTDATIIFPADLNTHRWINNINRVVIYQYKTDRISEESQEETGDDEHSKDKKKKN